MKTNIEDGYFTTQEPISEEEKEELEAGYDLTLEKQQYVDLEYHDTKLRLHTQTQNVDLYTISEGRDIESGDELVLTYNYAKANGIAVGDKLKLAGREFTVCGLGMKSDYAIMLYDLSETIPNKSGFGIGIITQETMAELGTPMEFYSVRYRDPEQERAFRKELYQKKSRIFNGSNAKLPVIYSIRSLTINGFRSLTSVIGIAIATLCIVLGGSFEDEYDHLLKVKVPDAMLGGQYEYGFQSFQTENPYGGAAVFDISFGAKKDNSRFNMIGYEPDNGILNTQTVEGAESEYGKYYMTSAAANKYGVAKGDSFCFYNTVTMQETTVTISGVVKNDILPLVLTSKENVAQVALAFTNFAVGAYIFNDVYESLVGRRPALDPISWANDFAGDATGKKLPNYAEALWAALKGEGLDLGLEEVDKKSGGGTIKSLGENMAQDIPFVGGLLDGGRVPISSAIPDRDILKTNAGNLATGDVNRKKGWMAIGKELAKPITYIAPPVGGGQAKKMIESTAALIRGGSYGIDNDGEEKLRFAVDADLGSAIKGLAFGQYAIGNSGDYVDSGFKMLSAKKTRAYKALTETGMKNTEAEDFIRSLPSKTKDMRKAILNSNLTAKQKNAIGKVLDKNSPDYTSKDSFAYSQMSDGEKETIDKLTRSGMTQKKATRIYEVQNQYSSQAEKVNALLEEGYRDAVFKALGMGEKGIAGGKALHAAGLDSSAYRYTKEKADTNDSGNVSIKEIKKYLDTTSYSRRQKFALAKALTGCTDKNNPYR